MKRAIPIFALTTAAGLLWSAAAGAFECPTHFAGAQAEIDRVAGQIKAATGVAKPRVRLVHALLDDARMALAGARHNHKKPQGAYDHARAIAKADAAKSYAAAAGMLLAR